MVNIPLLASSKRIDSHLNSLDPPLNLKLSSHIFSPFHIHSMTIEVSHYARPTDHKRVGRYPMKMENRVNQGKWLLTCFSPLLNPYVSEEKKGNEKVCQNSSLIQQHEGNNWFFGCCRYMFHHWRHSLLLESTSIILLKNDDYLEKNT